ncbi:hypothetical protein HUN08_13485 [Gordonia sp. X0973]|uniref:hypothetical protein n=1 Tax=Gordonia sp. X0973 TaxID=2742602 RepID=UPI000F54BAF3|nr:hypothetical protein [Gordonia sp. X0973]QKT08086.1 hypothetical protein HUN08_13485 [Gordonia sp. X0973]
MADKAESLFVRYVAAVSNVSGVSWTGPAAEAAQDTAYLDRSTVRQMTDTLGRAATEMDVGYHAIEAPLTKAKSLIADAEGEGFTVTEFLAVTKEGDLSEADERRRAELQSDIVAKAGEVESADNDTRQKLSAIHSQMSIQFGKIVDAAVVRGEHQFEKLTGHRPLSPVDLATAAALDPTSKDPKYKGKNANITVTRIRPVPGQGVVRTNHFIKEPDVTDPSGSGAFSRNMGDNRGPDPNFSPDHTRVTTYIDYENGLVVMRQNPSVVQNADGSPGDVQVGTPRASVMQAANGAVRIRYDANDPVGLGGVMANVKPGYTTVNGDIAVTPTDHGPRIDGTRTNYPWFEAYRTAPDGCVTPIAVDKAALGNSLGPSLSLPYHHDIGSGSNGPEAHQPEFYRKEWIGKPGYTPEYREVVRPGVPMGTIDNPTDASGPDGGRGPHNYPERGAESPIVPRADIRPRFFPPFPLPW